MHDEQTIALLNELLEAEYGNLIHRLGEADPYVAWVAAKDQVVVRRMMDDCIRHQRELVEMILRLRGAPIPPVFPMARGGVHYLRLAYLMPQVIASVREIVARYETASIAASGEAQALLGRLLADHKRHWMELKALHASAVPAGVGSTP